MLLMAVKNSRHFFQKAGGHFRIRIHQKHVVSRCPNISNILQGRTLHDAAVGRQVTCQAWRSLAGNNRYLDWAQNVPLKAGKLGFNLMLS